MVLYRPAIQNKHCNDIICNFITVKLTVYFSFIHSYFKNMALQSC